MYGLGDNKSIFLVVFSLLLCLLSPIILLAQDDAGILARSDFEYYQGLREDTMSVADIAALFIGRPYEAHTLDKNSVEQLVVNLSTFDCTTLVENSIALWQVGKTGTFEQFQQCLESLRYRDGIRSGYLSRLHYFSEWIANNEKRGNVVSICPQGVSSSIFFKLNFMSTHPMSYAQLQHNKERIDSLSKIEHQLSEYQHCYVPKAHIELLMPWLQSGDIIAFTTQLSGLDIMHVGVVKREGEKCYLIHAPAPGRVVEYSHEDIREIVQKRGQYSGVMVLRVLKR